MDRAPGFEPGGWRFEPSSVHFFIISTLLSVKTPIFSHTYQSFVDHIFAQLGKGRLHAGLIYEEFVRTGKFSNQNPAFNNAQNLYEAITSQFEVKFPEVIDMRHDGITGKFLLRMHDGLEVESVLIPMQSGGTLCISSQVGCRMGCSFCETGKIGLLRNLTVEEIIAQVFVARHQLKFPLRNIVFMGMGEPFDNYENVIQAAKVLTDPNGFGFGKRNITISTSGLVDAIDRFSLEGQWAPNLAVSINAPEDSLRNKLMPVNRAHDMQALHNAMQRYNQKTGRQILIAYVLMKDLNDSLNHADRLADYLEGLKVKVNLIPYNPQSRDRYKPPELPVLEMFTKRLRDRGYYTLLRVTKGSKIMAACGQLGNLELRKKKCFPINCQS